MGWARASGLTVAVIGAGPAGATAARLLAQRGARVHLLDAKRLPRHKLCGGGITPKGLPLLPAAALACVDRRVKTFELAGGRAGRALLQLPDVEVAMVERAPFDFALVNAAAAAGVDVSDGMQVLDIHQNAAERVELKTRRGSLVVDTVIAADGEPSRAAARLGLTEGASTRALGLEVDLPHAAGRDPDVLQLRFGVPAGYAWYFPKGDHANVGILTSDRRRQPELRWRLGRYVRELGMPLDGGRVQGHWLAMGLRRGPTVRDRVLLAGDAAGTADPFFGEGISFGMASGALAAQTVADWADGRIPSLEAYDGRVRRAFGPAFRRLSLVAAIADRMPTLSILSLASIAWARGEARRGLLGLGHPFAMPAIES